MTMHQRIAAICRDPVTMAVIVERTGCSQKDVYNLVQRGMLENVGSRRFGRFLVVPGTSLEPVREFRATPEIIQAASVWEYAYRCGQRAAMETRA